ncbi:hypothetical protein QR674_03500 [Acinetobacter chinensis]|jgi:hypothetical protein|uniref:DUF7944 domain-containing protein n=1 Tax=Acinetobacter chinensis TaxID=2004650 RepID=A0ABU3WCA7_9GAMM|nr:hypothetical protein [Acinetobacter chinensis]MDV2468043.1 hypothetical protein [Acinetobacter chinensis]WOE42781.1 hypothetical protein QSG87_06565 [Acinetobacter chinensis]
MKYTTFFRSLSGFIFAAVLTQAVSASEGLSQEEANTIAKEDIAAAQIMNEVCPAVTGNSAKIATNVKSLIDSYLKEYSDKSMTYEKLQNDTEYKAILQEARKDAQDTSKDEQKSVCDDVLNYSE